jgi:hypothetical protein
MSKIALSITVLVLALAASAGAMTPSEFRSDARPALATQDFRSPDARPAPVLAAQDFRSPDARPAPVPATPAQPATQDFRSPDGGAFPAGSAPAVQDLRSPDGRPTGAFSPEVPAAPALQPSDGSFGWGYLAAAIGAALLAMSAALITYRRRHHGLAPGA